MHEWVIVDSLIEEVIQRAKENKLRKIEKVCLSLGEDDHLTPDSLGFCFSSLTKGTDLEGVKLEIEKGKDNGVILNRIEGTGGNES